MPELVYDAHRDEWRYASEPEDIDAPKCVSPVIAEFLRSWSDALPDADRQMLKALIPQVIGTTRNKRDETKRAWMCADWLARECAPAFLRLAGLAEHAETLEGLAPLANKRSAEKAQPKLDAARDAAWAVARAAVQDAARAASAEKKAQPKRAAVQDAARAIAQYAEQAVARAAVWAAIWATFWTAAWAVARAAAWAAAGVAALEPTVKTLQVSALGLVKRMAEVGR